MDLMQGETSIDIYLITYFVVILTKTYTSLVLTLSLSIYDKTALISLENPFMDVETTFRHIFPFSALQCLLREILVQTKGSDYWQLIHCCRLVINGLFLALEYKGPLLFRSRWRSEVINGLFSIREPRA